MIYFNKIGLVYIRKLSVGCEPPSARSPYGVENDPGRESRYLWSRDRFYTRDSSVRTPVRTLKAMPSTAWDFSIDLDKKVLVVDSLNFMSRFIPNTEDAFKNAFAPAMFREMRARVARMASAAKAGKFKLVWVFDNGQSTEEAKEKWERRRLEEVRSKKRDMPQGAAIFFQAALEEAGFLVLYPEGIDGDDAVALLAWALEGDVLSRDRDFLRYGNKLPRQSVFSDFRIDNRWPQKLLLQPQRAPIPSGTEPRDLAALRHLLPADLSDAGLSAAWGRNKPKMCEHVRQGTAKDGNADSFTLECGNANAHALGLMASVYSALGASSAGVAFTLPAAVSMQVDGGSVDSWEELDADGRLPRAEIVTVHVPPDPCTAKRLVAQEPRLAREWIGVETTWPRSRTGPLGARDLAERAHAVCIKAAEIADAMQYALNGPPDDSYSPPRRVVSMYDNLVLSDKKLNPDLFDCEWWSGLTDDKRVGLRALFCPSIGTHPDTYYGNASTLRNNHWFRVVECASAVPQRQGRFKCAHLENTGHPGVCFYESIKRSAAKDRFPLCSDCMDRINAKVKAAKERENAASPIFQRCAGYAATV